MSKEPWSDDDEPTIYDAKASRAAMDFGIGKVAARNTEWIDTARLEALRIAFRDGTVCAEDVRRVTEAKGLYPDHPNAWGSVFRGVQELQWIPGKDGIHHSNVVRHHAGISKRWRIAHGYHHAVQAKLTPTPGADPEEDNECP
jgi:hypothetical protein